jgi:hypothetical protein
MTRLTQSYVHGASLTPLIGDTIGVHLDRMAGLSPDRLALVVRHQKIRWTYGEFRHATNATTSLAVASVVETRGQRRTTTNRELTRTPLELLATHARQPQRANHCAADRRTRNNMRRRRPASAGTPCA